MSVGSALAAARHARELGVEDVSAVTRIRPHLIRAIEADDLAACGGDVYARGHIRALARAVGVDPEPLLLELSGPARPAGIRAPAADASLVLRERRAAPSWMTALAVMLGVVACLAGLRLLLPGDGSGTQPAATSPTTRASGSAASPTPTPSPIPPTRISGSGALSVSFAVTGSRCWLAVRDSEGTTRLADTLSQGQTVTFRDDRKLSIVVGDVTAVTLTVNGREVSLRDARGGVKRFVVRASDPLGAFGESGSDNGGSRSPTA